MLRPIDGEESYHHVINIPVDLTAPLFRKIIVPLDGANYSNQDRQRRCEKPVVLEAGECHTKKL